VFQAELMDAHRGFALLARDDAAAAIEHSKQVIEKWRGHDAFQIAATGVWAQLFAHLYAGESLRALRLVEEHWPTFRQRGYSRAQPFKCSLMLWESSVRLARVRDTGDHRQLAIVERHIERMRPQGVVLSEASWRLLEAGVAHARGESTRAVELYAAAAERFEALGMVNYLTASRMRQAELTADPVQSAVLRARAEAQLAEHSIVHPERYMAMYAPIRARVTNC
jgi:hypothetical protein